MYFQELNIGNFFGWERFLEKSFGFELTYRPKGAVRMYLIDRKEAY